MPNRVSLVMACYNSSAYVRAAIESVMAQSYADWDLLVWDDGSTDDTQAIAREIAKRDPRVRVMNSKNRGFTQTLIASIAETGGPYIGWVDSDDLLAKDALKETVAVLDASPRVGMVYTSYQVINADGRVAGEGSRSKIPYSRDRLLLDFMTFHFRLIRRSVFDQVGGIDPSFVRAQDYDLCLRVSEVTDIHHLKKPLYFYRVHRKSVSSMSRLEQIMAAKEAIERAIRRRKLDNRFELELQLEGKFFLRPRNGLA